MRPNAVDRVGLATSELLSTLSNEPMHPILLLRVTTLKCDGTIAYSKILLKNS